MMSSLAAIVRQLGPCAVAVGLTLAGGCGALFPKATPSPSFYALDRALDKPGLGREVASAESESEPTLIVNPSSAAAGFDSQHMVYVRGPHAREYFAHTEWVDTPARMLAPLIVTAIEAAGGFRAVVRSPSAAAADIRLDTEIVRLEQDFTETPSRVRFTLRAHLVDDATRSVIATREFDIAVAASGDNPRAGAMAANTAVQDVLSKLGSLCKEAAGRWTRPVKG